MVTDYDCWHPGHDAVTVEQILANLQKNAAQAARLVRAAVARLAGLARDCACGRALAHALITDPAAIPAATREKLRLLLSRYEPASGH